MTATETIDRLIAYGVVPVIRNSSAELAGTAVSWLREAGYAPNAHAGWVYYTTNGLEYPEGSAGVGKGNTQVATLSYQANGGVDGNSTSQWWKATLPALPTGVELRYKVSLTRLNASDLFPFSRKNAGTVRMRSSSMIVGSSPP